jgi:hypothetical protein
LTYVSAGEKVGGSLQCRDEWVIVNDLLLRTQNGIFFDEGNLGKQSEGVFQIVALDGLRHCGA